VLAERLLEETMILDPESDSYTRLNATGRWVWEQLSAPRTVAELGNALAAEFGIDQGSALADVQAFVGEMVRRGLIEQAP
jgi:hypothetical protein